MLKKLEKLLKQSNTPQTDKLTLAKAAAALMLEVSYSDNEFADSERQSIEQSLKKGFLLSDQDIAEVIEISLENRANATDIYQFTKTISEHFDYPKRCQLLFTLWQAALADGVLDKHEEYTIRKICDLLYIDHSDFIQQKQLALQTLSWTNKLYTLVIGQAG